MKTKLFCAALALLLLTACAPPAPEATPTPAPDPVQASPEPAVSLACHIVDGAEDGTLLLAEAAGDGVYRLGTAGLEITLDGAPAQASDLRDGMLVEIFYDGGVQETYPMGFSGATALKASTEGLDDLCGLYLQVLEDLWAVDSGLNGGIDKLGMDLSELTGLSGSEKAAVMWRFAEIRGLELVQGTWQELADQGCFTSDPPEGAKDPASAAFYRWEDGMYFTLRGDSGRFDAEKWRSGLGAYFFVDCAARARDGVWSYAVGSEAIS